MKLWSSSRVWIGLVAAALAGCQPAKIPANAVGDGTSVYGVSANSVELKWNAIQTADTYQVFNLRQGNTPVLSTLFTDVTVNGLNKDTDYGMSVRGARGSSNSLSDPLNTWSFHTWPDFSNTTFAQAVQADSSTIISWNYQPWNTGLQASLDAIVGSDIKCLFLPVAAGTDPTQIPVFDASFNGTAPIEIDRPLYPGHMQIQNGDLDFSKYYAVSCSASFIDGTSSTILTAKRFLLAPSHILAACPTTGTVGSSYTCTPNLRPSNFVVQNPFSSISISLSPGNTCSWASVDPTGKQLVVSTTSPHAGLLLNQDAGTCNLSYVYTITDSAGNVYSSPLLSTTVTTTIPLPYTTFPSLAVRALSGTLGYPLIYSQVQGTTASVPRARILSDVFTDFGNNDPGLFAGANDPFPVFSSAALALPTSSFYGFPLAAQPSSGPRPLGYSLDAIRSSTISNGSSLLEGFLRGSLVVPATTISNSTFISYTGRNSPITLYNFLSNPYTYTDHYTYSGHASTTTGTGPALSTFLNTNSSFAGSSPFSGQMVEQTKVVIKSPTVQSITKYVRSNGVPGVIPVISTTDPTRPVSGLVQSTGAAQNTFVTNCPATPITDGTNPYPVVASCSGAPNVITCYGDVIINNPVLLVDANILTDSGGCRIYATGTVFIEGSLVAKDSSLAFQTVQISSSAGIVIGFSLQSLGANTSSSTAHRSGSGVGLLDQTYANTTTNPFLTHLYDAPGSAAAALDGIAIDAQTVGLTTTNPNTNGYATGITSSGTVKLSHIALNAPYIFSSYPGMFTGSIVGEVVIFPVLNFTADTMFKGMTPFPMYVNNTASGGTDDRVFVVTP